VCIKLKDNKLISRFRQKLTRQLRNKYSCEVGFAWVREQTESADTPHYHYAVFVNGHKAQNSFGFAKVIDKICDSLLYISPYYPPNNGYMIKRGDSKSIQKVIFRLSYLAKNKSKNNNVEGISDYQTSRLKLIT
jgi:hypothetical protein